VTQRTKTRKFAKKRCGAWRSCASNREDYSAALLTPRTLALLATTAVRSGPDGLNADAVASEAFAALCMIHATESDRDACATLEPRETYLALVEMAAIRVHHERRSATFRLTRCCYVTALSSAAHSTRRKSFCSHSPIIPANSRFAVNGDVLLQYWRYCGYSDYECIRTAALGALAAATANTTTVHRRTYARSSQR
jgi:hypothetical protein